MAVTFSKKKRSKKYMDHKANRKEIDDNDDYGSFSSWF